MSFHENIVSALFTRAKSLKQRSDRDGDGDGMIYDGTPQERPVGYDPKANVRWGKPQWNGTEVPQIAKLQNDAEIKRAQSWMNVLPYEDWSSRDPLMHHSYVKESPVARMYRALSKANLKENKDYELKFVPLSSVKLTQDGEDYNNPSSQELARKFKQLDIGDLAESEMRQEDLDPIILDSNGFVVDGHHRHAAHRMTGSKTILALVPKPGNGTRQIVNLRQFYDQTKAMKLPHKFPWKKRPPRFERIVYDDSEE